MPKTNHRRGFRENLGERRCSCSMCGNPRRNGWDNAPTRQEQLVALDDIPERDWPKAKKGPKRFTIEKRRIDRTGNPSQWWTELKRYRTEKDRDNALAGFRKSVRCYAIRWYQQGEEGLYTGPMDEYRVGPDHG